MTISHIKTKERVRDHGEVFTPDFIVNDMLGLVENEMNRIESRFLEPACGDGNFLAPILQHKIDLVIKKYGKSQTECEKNICIAIGSIYGVELLIDNVETCRNRLYQIFEAEYIKKFKQKCNSEFKQSIRYILDRNIIEGNALTLKSKQDTEYIVFSEWVMLSGGNIKRRDFEFRELADFNPDKPTLFSVREESDSGDPVFSPMPVRDYPLQHYQSLHLYE